LIIIFYVLSVNQLLYSQINIKERAEIKPGIVGKNKNIKTDFSTAPVVPVGMLKYFFSYNGGIRQDGPCHLFTFAPGCGGAEFIDDNFHSGSYTYDASNLYGSGGTVRYVISPPAGTWQLDSKWYYGSMVVWDGSLVLSGSGDYSTGYTAGTYTLGPPFIFQTPNDVSYGDSTVLSADQNNATAVPCQDFGWDPQFGITISITEGANYGELHDNNGNSLGSSVTCYISEVPLIRFVAKGTNPNPIGNVTLTAQSGAVTRTVSFKVKGVHLVVSALDSIISSGNTSNLFYNFYDTDNSVRYLLLNHGMTFTVTQGAEYGTLFDRIGGGSIDTITTPPDYYIEYFYFFPPIIYWASGVQPCSDQTVTIKVDPNRTDITPAFINIIVQPPIGCLSLQVSKDTIGTSDTTDVSIVQQTVCGTYIPDQETFDVSLDNANNGKLWSPQTNQKDSLLTDVPPRFKFIAAKKIKTDMAQVVISAQLHVSGGGGQPCAVNAPITQSQSMKASGISSKRTSTGMIDASKQIEKINQQLSTMKDTDKKKVGLSKAKDGLEKILALGYDGGQICSASFQAAVVIEQSVILLGESKYYYAKQDPNNSNNLIINGTTTLPPSLGAGGLPNATFDDPVAATGSAKNPVYWEDQYPTYNGTTLTGSNKLPKGMIRLVGRYWEQGKTFKTILTAHTPDGKSGSIDIEVKKPMKLIAWNNITGNDKKEFENNTQDYSKTKDVFGKPLNVDDLIINLAGGSGIPPQLIKAQMYQEANKDFYHFNPSYRYEPFQDYNWQISKKDDPSDPFLNQPFFIISTSPHGNGAGIPQDHSNLYPKGLNPPGYPTNSISISQYVLNNWDKYLNVNTSLTSLFRSVLVEHYNVLLAGINPYDFAEDVTKAEINKKYNIYAQTRKVASYGFLQLLYTTAYNMGYNKGVSVSSALPPENLNDDATFIPFYKGFTISNLSKVLHTNAGSIPDHDWSLGWEETWKSTLAEYNGSIYSNKVMKTLDFFDPQ
jgi:hypothetical protein